MDLTTIHKEHYRGGAGDRYEIKRPGSAGLWQNSSGAPVDMVSTARDAYKANAKGER